MMIQSARIIFLHTGSESLNTGTVNKSRHTYELINKLGITIAVSAIAGAHIRFAYGAAFGAGGVLDGVGLGWLDLYYIFRSREVAGPFRYQQPTKVGLSSLNGSKAR
jgi:hypothetical protein